jgi:hypothetical protein
MPELNKLRNSSRSGVASSAIPRHHLAEVLDRFDLLAQPRIKLNREIRSMKHKRLEASHERLTRPLVILELSNSGQSAIPSLRIFTAMEDTVRLLAAELDGDDGLVVTFSDGTTDAYVAEELLELRPYRERLRSKNLHNLPAEGPNHDNPERNGSGAGHTRLRRKVSHPRH